MTHHNAFAAQTRRATGETTRRPQTRYTLDDYTGAPPSIQERHRAAYAAGSLETFTPELQRHLERLASAQAAYEAETFGPLFGSTRRPQRTGRRRTDA